MTPPVPPRFRPHQPCWSHLSSLAGLIALSPLATARAGTINVPKDFPAIQTAIIFASDGDEIIVAPGTYDEAINFNGKAINLHSSGNASNTIIDGTGFNASVVTCQLGEGPGTILNGFTITGGHSGTPLPPGCFFCEFYGFGMCNYNSSPTIENCIFSGNGSASDSQAFHGGGMANVGGANPTITNCQFLNNTFAYGQFNGPNGGGMWNGPIDAAPVPPNVTVTDCTFSGNAAYWGGGIMNWGSLDSDPGQGANTTIVNCTFTNNTAFSGGGLFNGRCAGTVTGCQFTNNTASLNTSNGGGGMRTSNASTSISNCTFTGNQAAYGAGLAVHHASISSPSPTVVNCSFINNSSPTLAGGMSIENSKPLIRNCVFQGNTAISAAGILGQQCGAEIVNCLFFNNTAARAGAMRFRSMSGTSQTYFPVLTNCTVIGNTASAAGFAGGIEVQNDGFAGGNTPIRISNCIIRDNPGTVNISFPTNSYPGWRTLQYSNVNGTVQGPYTGTHNINANPMFANVSTGDFHLLAGSPCIDAGNHWAFPKDVTTDFDGNPRIADGNGDGIAWVDMGAYEFQGTPGTLGVFPPPLAYWHFNTLNPQTANIPADTGQGTISTSTWGGTVDFGDGAFFDMNSFGGAPAGTSLRLENSFGGNGTYIQISLSMTGRQHLVATMATFPSNNATYTGTWSYSTDGVGFTSLPSTNFNEFPVLQTADLSPVLALNNAPSVTLRYTITGLPNSSDYLDIDNLQLNAEPMPLCPSDITGGGTVNTADLLMVINSWGACAPPCPPHCAADIAPSGGDCVVNTADLLAVINAWGPCE